MVSDWNQVEQLRRRDATAWDLLYAENVTRTYRALYHLTGAKAWIIEELNQDVWLSAIESIENFDGKKGSPEDWILGIARFKGLTYLRKYARERVTMVGVAVPSLVAESESIESEMETQERVGVLRACLACLPEHWQRTLRWKYSQGKSVKEIACLMGATPKSVESILSRARSRLRELVENTFRGVEEQ